MSLCIPISPTSSTSSHSSLASPSHSPSSSPPSSNPSPSSSPNTMSFPFMKQERGNNSTSASSETGSSNDRSVSRPTFNLQHLNNSSSTLKRRHPDSTHSSDTPRASEFSARRSPSPSARFSSMSFPDTINSQDFRLSTLSTLTIGQYQTCHPYFWFSDGSVVLSVQTTLFKVHMSTLATHSEMFADMFHVGQPLVDGQIQSGDHQDEWFDGCRVVKLFDDSSDDWIDLLGAIYKPDHFDDVPSRHFQIRHTSSQPSLSTPGGNATTQTLQAPFNLSAALDFTSGILRLSHKYLVPHLRARCLALLAPFFPTTFEDFSISMPMLNPEFFESPPPSTRKKSGRDSSPLMTRTSTLLRAVNLFHTVDIPQFLPYAYYCLSKLSSKRILHTRELDPGKPQKDELSWREKAMIIHGKEQLRLAAMNDTMTCLGRFRRTVGCTSEYEEDGTIHSPMYSHHVALKECDYAARGAWEDILRGDFGYENRSDVVRGGGATTVAANAAWASTASLLALSVNATSHSSAYAPPPIAASASSDTTISRTSLPSLNFPSSPPESIHVTDPLAPFLLWDILGPSASPYLNASSSSRNRLYTSPSHSASYTSLLYPYHQQPSYKLSGDPVMCRACLNECQIQHYEARQKVWDALPEMFGLGTWDELRRRSL